MHLGLIDGSFVPHNLISIQESPVSLLKFQMAHRLKILMSSGSKKWTQIYFFFLSKIPAYEPTPGSSAGPLWRDTRYRAFCISLENLIKIPLNKKALKERPSVCPKGGPLRKQTPISEPYLTYLSGFPVKETSLKVPFMESLAERCPVPRALLHSSFKVPDIWALLLIPGSLRLERDLLERRLRGTVLSKWFF
jgi:hypothetical protein